MADSYLNVAIPLIKQFEGYRSTPYWDVNAHRVGYGSDTITLADGSVHKVKPNTTVTKADAERDLQRRAREFAAGVARTIGQDSWNRLPDTAKAALTSMAYNYGNIGKFGGIVSAAKAGDLQGLAQQVLRRTGDNGGILSVRRSKEANLILGKMPTDYKSSPDKYTPDKGGFGGLTKAQTYDSSPDKYVPQTQTIQAQAPAAQTVTPPPSLLQALLPVEQQNYQPTVADTAPTMYNVANLPITMAIRKIYG